MGLIPGWLPFRLTIKVSLITLIGVVYNAIKGDPDMLSLRSKVTRKVLTYFFSNPHESLYVNEMAFLLGVDKRNLVKKLRELESIGLMRSKARGNLRLYSVNPSYPLYREYKRIFQKTVGVEISA